MLMLHCIIEGEKWKQNQVDFTYSLIYAGPYSKIFFTCLKIGLGIRAKFI